MSDLEPILDEILRCLGHYKVRATYGAVAAVAGGIPQSVGMRLGVRRPAASWVVNADERMPTKYLPGQRHPDLTVRDEIITDGEDLQALLAHWRAKGCPS